MTENNSNNDVESNKTNEDPIIDFPEDSALQAEDCPETLSDMSMEELDEAATYIWSLSTDEWESGKDVDVLDKVYYMLKSEMRRRGGDS